MLDHTEGVSLSSMRLPYLRRNMPFPALASADPNASTEGIAATTESANGVPRNWGIPIFSHDGLVIRISPNNYHLLYDPYTSDWWLQGTATRKRGLSGYEEVRAKRERGLAALYEGKEQNEWMRGMDDSEIDGTKKRFDRWLKEGPKALTGELDPVEDTVMADTA